MRRRNCCAAPNSLGAGSRAEMPRNGESAAYRPHVDQGSGVRALLLTAPTFANPSTTSAQNPVKSTSRRAPGLSHCMSPFLGQPGRVGRLTGHQRHSLPVELAIHIGDQWAQVGAKAGCEDDRAEFFPGCRLMACLVIGDAPALSEVVEPLNLKAGRLFALSTWLPRQPRRPTARAV